MTNKENLNSLTKERIATIRGYYTRMYVNSDRPGCVDGRAANGESRPGPQMPGASLFPPLLGAIFHGQDYLKQIVVEGISKLKHAGFGIGVHHGDHQKLDKQLHIKDQKSDCGLSDNLPRIVGTAFQKQEEIIQRLNAVYEENKQYFQENNIDLPAIVTRAYTVYTQWYTPERIQVFGEEAVTVAQSADAENEHLLNDHLEIATVVNLVPDCTFDTNAAVTDEVHVFSFDIPAAVKQSAVFGVDQESAIGLSLILYVATEMVLVEDKGKPALPVLLNT